MSIRMVVLWRNRGHLKVNIDIFFANVAHHMMVKDCEIGTGKVGIMCNSALNHAVTT